MGICKAQHSANEMVIVKQNLVVFKQLDDIWFIHSSFINKTVNCKKGINLDNTKRGILDLALTTDNPHVTRQ